MKVLCDRCGKVFDDEEITCFYAAADEDTWGRWMLCKVCLYTIKDLIEKEMEICH